MLTIKELYKSGSGPSSSHTIGPTRCCKRILEIYKNKKVDFIKVILYGSLALTGVGHHTDKAINRVLSKINHEIINDIKTTNIPHPNTLDFEIYYENKLIGRHRFMSIGGGTIIMEGDKPLTDVYPQNTFEQIKTFCKKKKFSAYQYVCHYEGKQEMNEFLDHIWKIMSTTIQHGITKKGKIPGHVAFDRRANKIFTNISSNEDEHTKMVRLISSYAYATNEENTCGGEVVTAPTCGSCGLVPAVLKYLVDKYKLNQQQIREALAVGAIIGNVIKKNATVSGAEGGCQAEVGVACSMAAAMTSYVLYNAGWNEMEIAAENALQHLLGLTCDAVCGYVFVPCIQRNAVFALRAIDHAILAHLIKDTSRLVKFDDTIKTMKETGDAIPEEYRETSLAGLSKNAPYVLKFRKK